LHEKYGSMHFYSNCDPIEKGLAILRRIMHTWRMRTHRTILRESGHDQIMALTNRPITTVRSWDQRDSIPADLWLDIATAGFSTLEELAAGASRKRPKQGATA
jgi:hypothetical protein